MNSRTYYYTIDGLILDGMEYKYDIMAEAAARLNHYLYSIAQKTLTISSNGITII